MMFEEYITKDIETDQILQSIIESSHQNWTIIDKKIKEMEHVSITYSDRYLNTPLGCIVLGNLINQLKKTFNLSIDKLTIMRPKKDADTFSQKFYDCENDDTFTLEKDFRNTSDCDHFVQKCLKEIANVYAEVKHDMLPHYRSLTIKSKNYELSIRPDGGIAYGWILNKNIYPHITYKEINKELSQSLSLHNKAIRSGGILYTIAFKEQNM